MKRRRFYVISILVLLFAAIVCLYHPSLGASIQKGYAEAAEAAGWDGLIAASVNKKGISLRVDGTLWNDSSKPVYMDDSRRLMIPLAAVKSLFCAWTAVYEEKDLVIMRNTLKAEASLESTETLVNGKEADLGEAFVKTDGSYYVSAELLSQCLNYSVDWDDEKAELVMTDEQPGTSRLPIAYDAREYDRVPKVRDQGTLGTCWAFAAVGALEASLLPEEVTAFSPDHMSLNNAYGRDQKTGGEYTVAASYLLSWKGPVSEEDDPYGDGKTDASLLPVKHVQELQILPKKDLSAIKEAVYLYGGVQSSLYFALTDSKSESEYYCADHAAYYYAGTEKMNHDVLILGWDDNYPASNFNTPPEGNGAFLCLNSWGTEFGEDGYFWVSYFDSGIGIYNISYTGIEGTDNYDHIYQTDLCGWVGQLGYGQEMAYFANVYTADSEETLEAVGFYAVGSQTEYEVYVISNFTSTDQFGSAKKAASGSFANPGYYTVKLNQAQKLKEGESFAVMVYIRTPGEERPIAVEYSIEAEGVTVDLTDGEGYISLNGKKWQSAENRQKCNLCLKAYTDNVPETDYD